MAVQKSKKSRSKRGHRRSNIRLNLPLLFLNKKTNTYNLYHHIDKSYVINRKKKL